MSLQSWALFPSVSDIQDVRRLLRIWCWPNQTGVQANTFCDECWTEIKRRLKRSPSTDVFLKVFTEGSRTMSFFMSYLPRLWRRRPTVICKWSKYFRNWKVLLFCPKYCKKEVNIDRIQFWPENFVFSWQNLNSYIPEVNHTEFIAFCLKRYSVTFWNWNSTLCCVLVVWKLWFVCVVY